MRFCELAVAIAAMTISFAATNAAAGTNTVIKAGDWQAFDGTTTNGQPVCGISTDVGGRYLGVKYFAGRSTAVVQMGGKNLKIDDDEKRDVRLRIDDHSGWRGNGTGFRFSDGDPGIEFQIKKSELDQFVEDVQSGHSLIVTVLSTSNGNWDFDLAGTRSVHTALAKCLRELPSSWSEKK